MQNTKWSEEELRLSTLNGDLGFLRNCVNHNAPNTYYLTIFTIHLNDNTTDQRNIFHMAVEGGRENYIVEAIKILPLNVTQDLILQQVGGFRWNPLHLAAFWGHAGIVKLFLDVFKINSETYDKPWLQQDSFGKTPCHVSLYRNQEECAFEILRVDPERICNVIDIQGCSVLFIAVDNQIHKFALEILRSDHSFKTSGFNASSALYIVPQLTDEKEAICKMLIQKDLNIITQTVSSNGFSILHNWACYGTLWPFKLLLESKDICALKMKDLVNFISLPSEPYGYNPIHLLVAKPYFTESFENEIVEIVNLLIETYRRETDAQASNPRDSLPWLACAKNGTTPLSLAIQYGYEDFAKKLLFKDNNALLMFQGNALHSAVQYGSNTLALYMLEIIENNGWDHLYMNEWKRKANVLHVAPKCKEFFKKLSEVHPEFLQKPDGLGNTVLHSWIIHYSDDLWPIQYLLQNDDTNVHSSLKQNFIKLISFANKYSNTPFHDAAFVDSGGRMIETVKILAEAFKQDKYVYKNLHPSRVPWIAQNEVGQGPLHLALSNQNEELALYILSLQYASIINILDYYTPQYKTLFLAVEKKCHRVAKKILEEQLKQNWTLYIMDYAGRSLFHIIAASASQCTASEREFGTWLVEQMPEFVIKRDDKSRRTPLDEACYVGADWMVTLMLTKYPHALKSTPPAWVYACEQGHISTVRAFVDCDAEMFREYCREHNDSPLHHIKKFSSRADCKNFLDIQNMKDKELINLSNSKGETPLHKAIEKEDKFLVKALLQLDGIKYDMKDREGKTAHDMLGEKCRRYIEWEKMCKDVGIDPKTKTGFFLRTSKMFEVRNTLSVVAALLATITFTAGFTVPGGFKQDKGEAILAKKAAFLVFLIADALAMCCSMTVLICLIWSTVLDAMSESTQSLVLIDRSMFLLLLALYSTSLAFMTGVYVVTFTESLWASILVVIMCSLIIFSASKKLSYKVLNKIPSITWKHSWTI